MARIKIRDLSKNRKISTKEMKEVLGGYVDYSQLYSLNIGSIYGGSSEEGQINLIEFAQGDVRTPVVLGSLSSSSEKPPE